MAAGRAYALRLLQLLLQDRKSYFDRNGYLNSEGRKVLERAARALLREDERLRGYVRRARRGGSYEDVLRLVEALGGNR